MGKRLRGRPSPPSASPWCSGRSSPVLATAAARSSREPYSLSDVGQLPMCRRHLGGLDHRGPPAHSPSAPAPASWPASSSRTTDSSGRRPTHGAPTGLTLHWSGRMATSGRRRACARRGHDLHDHLSRPGLFTVTDDAGNVIVRDRGSIRETILFDTLGDDSPDGEAIESVSIRASGQHPGCRVRKLQHPRGVASADPTGGQVGTDESPGWCSRGSRC